MNLIGIGDSYPPTYSFDNLNAEQEFAPTTTPIVQQVSGEDGAYDFFGDTNYPLAPLTIIRRFKVQGSDYDDVATKLDTLRQYTIATGLVKLWAQKRYGSRKEFFAYAKCVGLRYSDGYNEKSSTLPVEVTWYIPTGLWHWKTQRNINFDNTDITGFAPLYLEQGGNYRTPFTMTVTLTGGNMTSFRLDNVTTGDWFSFTGTVASGNSLVVDTGTYEVTNGGADAYADFSFGSGQVQWMYISNGGSDEIDFTVTKTGSAAAQFLFYDSDLL